MSDTISHRERVALRKVGNLENFKFFAWEHVGGDATIMEGCVTVKLVQKGKRKGLPAYEGERVRVVVTDAEIVAEAARYAAETGNCPDCMGSKEEWRGWARDTGHRYETCRRCGGSGLAENNGLALVRTLPPQASK